MTCSHGFVCPQCAEEAQARARASGARQWRPGMGFPAGWWISDGSLGCTVCALPHEIPAGRRVYFTGVRGEVICEMRAGEHRATDPKAGGAT